MDTWFTYDPKRCALLLYHPAGEIEVSVPSIWFGIVTGIIIQRNIGGQLLSNFMQNAIYHYSVKHDGYINTLRNAYVNGGIGSMFTKVLGLPTITKGAPFGGGEITLALSEVSTAITDGYVNYYMQQYALTVEADLSVCTLRHLEKTVMGLDISAQISRLQEMLINQKKIYYNPMEKRDAKKMLRDKMQIADALRKVQHEQAIVQKPHYAKAMEDISKIGGVILDVCRKKERSFMLRPQHSFKHKGAPLTPGAKRQKFTFGEGLGVELL